MKIVATAEQPHAALPSGSGGTIALPSPQPPRVEGPPARILPSAAPACPGPRLPVRPPATAPGMVLR
jgi:hypothetical protein